MHFISTKTWTEPFQENFVLDSIYDRMSNAHPTFLLLSTTIACVTNWTVSVSLACYHILAVPNVISYVRLSLESKLPLELYSIFSLHLLLRYYLFICWFQIVVASPAIASLHWFLVCRNHPHIQIVNFCFQWNVPDLAESKYESKIERAHIVSLRFRRMESRFSNFDEWCEW